MFSLAHRHRLDNRHIPIHNGIGPQGPIGAPLQGRQVKDSAKGYRHIDVYPRMHQQKVGQPAPPVKGKDWDRPKQKTQYGWEIHDLRPPDLLHQPIEGELAQYSWKNKVANIQHAADLAPTNAFVPRRSSAPFIQPRDYVPRGGQLPRVTDTAGESEEQFTPQGIEADESTVTSLETQAHQPELRTFGGGIPFSQTSFMGRTGTQQVAGPTGRPNLGMAMPGFKGNQHPSGSTRGRDRGTAVETPAPSFNTQELNQLRSALQSNTQALQQQIQGTSQQQWDPSVHEALSEMMVTLNQIQQASIDISSRPPPPSYKDSLPAQQTEHFIQVIEKLDASIGNVAVQLQNVQQQASASSSQTLQAIQAQLTRYDELTTQTLSALSGLQQQHTQLDARLLAHQEDTMQGIETQITRLIQANQRFARPEDVNQLAEHVQFQLGRALQQMEQLAHSSMATQAGTQVMLLQYQTDLRDQLAQLHAHIDSAPAVDRPALQAILDQAQQTGQTVASLQTAIAGALPAPETQSLLQIEAAAPGMGQDAPQEQPANVYEVDTDQAPAVNALPADHELGGPIIGGGLSYNDSIHNFWSIRDTPLPARPPNDVPIDPDRVQEPPSDMGVRRYTQHPYPTASGGRPFPLLDRTKPLIDQDMALFREYGTPRRWNDVAVHHIGKENKTLFFAIRKTLNAPNPELALEQLRQSVMQGTIGSEGQGGPSRRPPGRGPRRGQRTPF